MRRLAAPILLLGACGTPTEIVVVVEGDLNPEVVRAEIRREAAVVATNDFFDALPFSFVVVPEEDDTTDVGASLTALDADRNAVVTSTVVTGFRAGERVLLRVPLERACVGVACSSEQRCLEGRCVSQRIPAELLPAVKPGAEL